MNKNYLIFILLSLSNAAFSAEDTPHSLPDNHIRYWSIQYDNDFLGAKSDKYYTQGFELSYAKQHDTPKWLTELADYLPLYKNGDHHGVTYSIGQKVFSPENIESTDLQQNDRPYAAYLYAAVNYINSIDISPDIQHVNFIELTTGIIGPAALGEEVQNTLHKLIHTQTAEGWQHQLENELALNAAYSHKWRYFQNRHGEFQTEISPHTSIIIGNIYTYASAGFMYRWGKGLKRDMGPPNIRPGFLGTTYFAPRFDPNWYLFFGHELRLIARNIFLDGNTFTNSHSIEKKPVVGDLLLGVAIHKNKIRIAFSHMIRSKEFISQKKVTHYGSLNFTYYF